MVGLSRALTLAVVAQLVLGTAGPAAELAPASSPYSTLPLGERVRITVSGFRVEGTVASSDPMTLTLLMKNGVTYRANPESIDQMEVARRRGWLAGAGRGALIGGLSLAALTAASLPGQMEEPDGACTDSLGTPQVCTTGRQLAESLAIGAVTGAVIGMLFPGTSWKPIATGRVRVSVAPSVGGGVAVQTAIAF